MVDPRHTVRGKRSDCEGEASRFIVIYVQDIIT